MPNPTRHPRDASDEIYTCPDETRGHYYSGTAKVSLVDRSTQKIIDTLEIKGNYNSEGNVLDLPYLIHRGFYEVPRLDRNGEGKPVLLTLKDYNGDGKAHEFALFDAVACMGLPTTLIGYSEKRDRLIHYQTELKSDSGTTEIFWVDYLFRKQPDKRGVWKYEIDYRGRGGTLDRYEIRYDPTREMFYGKVTSVADGENK
jgi:hypothetical protein